MKINETKYFKRKINNLEKECLKIVKREEGVYEITSVKLYYDKLNRNLLKQASIKDYIENTISDNLNLIIYNKVNLISVNEFEEAMKKAFGHFIRKIPSTDIFVARESKLDKKLEINYVIEDEPEIIVRRFSRTEADWLLEMDNEKLKLDKKLKLDGKYKKN